MTLIVISVDRELLPKHTDDDFEKWVEYQVGYRADISMKNPLHDLDMQAGSAEVREWG